MDLDTGILLDLANRPGELQRVTTVLADAGVNITGISAIAMGDTGRIALLLDDPARGQKALAGADVDHETASFLSLELVNRPGELDKALERLAEAGVNVESVLATADATPRLSFLVSDPDAAADALRR